MWFEDFNREFKVQLNSDNSNAQGERKIVRIIKCSIYQKLTRNTPGLLPVTEGEYKNGVKIDKAFR